jgi:hypothetical protein
LEILLILINFNAKILFFKTAATNAEAKEDKQQKEEEEPLDLEHFRRQDMLNAFKIAFEKLAYLHSNALGFVLQCVSRRELGKRGRRRKKQVVKVEEEEAAADGKEAKPAEPEGKNSGEEVEEVEEEEEHYFDAETQDQLDFDQAFMEAENNPCNIEEMPQLREGDDRQMARVFGIYNQPADGEEQMWEL